MSSSIRVNSDRLERINHVAAGLIDSQQFCGISWRFAEHTTLLSSGDVGCLDKPHGKPLPTDAIYRIYSMTKPLVSVLALQLIEEGVLRLADPVALHLPAFANAKVLQDDGSEAPAKAWMLIEHLLTHRAGLSYDFLPRCEIARRYQEVNLIERGARSLAEFVKITQLKIQLVNKIFLNVNKMI